MRRENDLYPTPQWVVDIWAGRLSKAFDVGMPRVHDLGSGDGRIGDSMIASFGCSKVSYEITDGHDCIKRPPSPGPYYDNIVVSNPPFSQAQEFLEMALGLDRVLAVSFLLRVNHLGSKKRADFWNKNPFSTFYVLTPRPSFVGGKTDSCEYGIFNWYRTEYREPFFSVAQK